MARTNYSFAKHQREIANKQKKEEKRQRKAGILPKPEAADPIAPDTPAPPQTP